MATQIVDRQNRLKELHFLAGITQRDTDISLELTTFNGIFTLFSVLECGAVDGLRCLTKKIEIDRLIA